jgi:peptide/nickel transport system permease protein
MKYYLNKIGVTLITLVLISIIVFGVFQLLPGDPVKVMIGVEGDPNQEAML